MDAEVSTEILSSKIEEMKFFYNNKIIHQFFNNNLKHKDFNAYEFYQGKIES